MKATLKGAVKAAIEAGLRPHGYRVINPAHHYGIDPICDIQRLSKAYGIGVHRIFDVGANVGRSSLAFRSAWPGARIFAFEPNAALIPSLRANLGADPTVSIEAIALGRHAGRSRFFQYEHAPDLNSLHAESPYNSRFATDATIGEVEVITLDDFCRMNAINRINLLKMDTEGSDYDVLLGAKDSLASHKVDFVYCEFNSLDTVAGRLGSLLPIASLLSECKYNFIASYNDYIVDVGRFFSVSNALFVADH